jgi:sulfate adenylyltransferase
LPDFTEDPEEVPTLPSDQISVASGAAAHVAGAAQSSPGARSGGLPGPNLPHGGRLVQRLLPEDQAAEAAGRALELRQLPLDERAAADLEMMATGALSPLAGFMGREDYAAVLESMHLSAASGGLLWPLPIVLPVDPAEARRLRDGEEVALALPGGPPLATLTVEEVFLRDLEREAKAVYGTADPAHPGVAMTLAQPRAAVAGPVRVFRLPEPEFPAYRLTPLETRRIFDARGWRTVAGFQTRNPVHRAHEYIQKCALEIVDGLLLHPLVGKTKDDDVPAPVRIRSYEVLFENYYPKDRVLLAVFPAAMRYAGPREAVFHAICRKNYGCTHFIVGRDHAGVGGFYGPFEAQNLVRTLADEIGVTPLPFDNAFYCRRCGGMATAKTCPHPASEHVVLSGTAVRAMLRRGETPPPEYSRPEVARLLAEAMRGQGE